MVIGAGGADTMIKAMVARLAALGGTVHLNAEVAEVVRESGRAVGIRLAERRDGRREARRDRRRHADGARGSACFPAARGDARYDAAREEFRLRPGHDDGASRRCPDLPDWSAGEELKRFAYVHLAPDLDMMARTYSEAMAGLLPAEPVLVVGQPTAIDPSRAPAGKHILWVQVRVLPAEIRGDAAGTIAARDWDAAKEAYADRVARHHRALRAGHEGEGAGALCRVARPISNAATRTSSAATSSPAAITCRRISCSARSPAGRAGKTPVKDLYMIGASTWPGAGTGAGSGYMLAKMLAGR